MNGKITSQDLVQMKTLYVKFLFMKDGKKKSEPFFYKTTSKSENTDPVYDMAVFNAFTHFGSNGRQRELCEEVSKKTKERLQSNSIHTMSDGHPTLVQPSYGKLTTKSLGDLNEAEFYLGKPPKNSIWKLTPFYNSFQREKEDREWAGVGADFFTEEIHLVVDFSSLISFSNVDDLFLQKPTAFWNHTKIENTEDDIPEKTSIEIMTNDGPLFLVSRKKIPKKDYLSIEWKINWDLLE